MFGDFAEKQETFLTFFFFYFNKPCSLKSKKSHFFAFISKNNANFSFIQIWSKED